MTRSAPHVLAVLRDAGIPFLRGADEQALRGLAVGMRTMVKRQTAGPLAPPPRDAPARFAALGGDDRFELLGDNAGAFARKLALISAATSRIDCALYYVADDDAGRRFTSALAGAARRGVAVRLAVDAFATEEKQFVPFGFGEAPDGSFARLEELRAAGVDVRVVGDARYSLHRKFLLVDGRTIVLGGRNVADHYARPGWRDLELLIEGPLVAAFAETVEGTFQGARFATAETDGVVEGVPGARGAVFRRTAAQLLARARRSVDIEHAYVLEHPWLSQTIAGAIGRGVRVRLLTNSGASNDLPFMTWRAATSLEALRRLGVEVHRRTSPGATLHTKLFIGDGRWVLTGSTNLDYYSATYCAELDVAIESETLGEACAAFFESGLAEPDVVRITEGSDAHRALLRECTPWSVSRALDVLARDLQ